PLSIKFLKYSSVFNKFKNSIAFSGFLDAADIDITEPVTELFIVKGSCDGLYPTSYFALEDHISIAPGAYCSFLTNQFSTLISCGSVSVVACECMYPFW